HQGEVSCPLDRSRKLTLMTSTVARDASRNNLTPLSHQVPQAPHIFVIDQGQFVGAEPTDLFAKKAAAFACRRFLPRNDCHCLTPPIYLNLKKEYRRPRLGEHRTLPLSVWAVGSYAPCLGATASAWKSGNRYGPISGRQALPHASAA